MKLTLLGTANPIPTVDRAGNAISIEAGGEVYLVDCGPRTVYELLRHEIDPGAIEKLFITHNHMDHNLSFFHLAIVGWTAGRQSMVVYGPAGTGDLIDGLYDIWERDLEYRKEVGYPPEGIEDITWSRVTDGFEVATGSVRVTAMRVAHSIETYGYKFVDVDRGTSAVLTSDTAKIDRLVEFGADADVLVMSCGITPVGDPPENGFVWERYTEPYPDEMKDALMNYHVDPTQAGEIAEAAGVDTLVLTHFPPYPDRERIRSEVAAVYDGEVIPARDGFSIDV